VLYLVQVPLWVPTARSLPPGMYRYVEIRNIAWSVVTHSLLREAAETELLRMRHYFIGLDQMHYGRSGSVQARVVVAVAPLH
jgi:hypothetical protein